MARPPRANEGAATDWNQWFKSHAHLLGHELLAVVHGAEAVDGGQVGEGGGLEDVGGEAAAADFPAGMLQLNLYLAQRLLALGDGADAVVAELDGDAGEALDSAVDGV